MVVNDYDTLRLASVSVNVYLKNHMLADPELAAATTMFTRAAKIIARVEDSLIFNGKQPGAARLLAPKTCKASLRSAAPTNTRVLFIMVVHRPVRRCRLTMRTPSTPGPRYSPQLSRQSAGLNVKATTNPTHCVLATDLFTAIYRPNPELDGSARRRLPALLDGPLLRASSLRKWAGSGDFACRAIRRRSSCASDISVRYLQGTLDGLHAFRVSERFVLRVKEPTAIVLDRTQAELKRERKRKLKPVLER